MQFNADGTMRTAEQEASNIVVGKPANYPHPRDPTKRIVGWVVHEDDVGLGTALLALDKIAAAWRGLFR